jgi:hypothetical protein
MTNYKLSSDSKGESLILIYEDGDPVTVPGTHPRFSEILELLRSGDAEDEKVKELVNIMHAAGKKLSAITDRVSIAPYGVFFDGDILRSELAEIIGDMLDEGRGDDLAAVAKFLENAAANQSIEAIDAMYRWITNRDMILTSEGTFLAYKGVKKDASGKIVSITSGTALVDGEEFTGNIPNPVGSVITMPRSAVTADTAVGCGPGLHAGTYSYARSFAGYNAPMLLVEINPRDVVSVPSDSSFQKLRVSRYKVIEHIEGRQESNYYEFEDTAPVEDDGDFTEEGAVDEQETAGNVIGTATVNVVTEETKDEKPEETSIGTLTVGTVNGNSPVFGDPYTLKVDGSIDASKLEEKEEEKPSTLDKFKKWWTGE